MLRILPALIIVAFIGANLFVLGWLICYWNRNQYEAKEARSYDGEKLFRGMALIKHDIQNFFGLDQHDEE